jgi:hypothetical protein
MANFPVNPLPFITGHAVIEEGPADRIQRSLLVVGEPPLSHEDLPQFLAWMQRQISTRTILPADPEMVQQEAAIFFSNFVNQLAEVVRSAELGSVLYTRQLSVHELFLLQTFAASRSNDVAGSASVIISELENNIDSPSLTELVAPGSFGDFGFLTDFNSEGSESSNLSVTGTLMEVQNQVLNKGLMTTAALISDVASSSTNAFATVSSPEDSERNISVIGTIVEVQPQTLNTALMTSAALNSDATSSSTIVPSAMVVPRARGRPRRSATPSVENQVRRSTRQFNDGVLYALPNSTRRRSSSVLRASSPATLQISEMKRIGVEECFIDETELTEERLMQARQAED